jgi:hypothetical protein
MKRNLILILMLVCYITVILSFYICFLIITDKPESKLVSETEIDCSNDDILEMSLCLKKELEKIYKYNLSNTGKELTFEELKEWGGVCSHYAEWYKQELIKLGGTYLEDDVKRLIQKEDSKFYITKNQIPITKNIGHVYTIISNDKYYCSLDQLNIKCVEFK